MPLDEIPEGALETPSAWLAIRFRHAAFEPRYLATQPDGTELVEYRFRTEDGVLHVVRIVADFLRDKVEGDIFYALSVSGVEEELRAVDGKRAVYLEADGRVRAPLAS